MIESQSYCPFKNMHGTKAELASRPSMLLYVLLTQFPFRILLFTIYIGAFAPCIGLHMPLTDSLSLVTTLPPFTLLSFSPLASLKSSTFFSICSFSKFLTQIVFSLPLIYMPRTIGCRDGRGEMCISIWGCVAAKGRRRYLRNELERPVRKRV